jgi:hypothetical protein
MLNYRFAWHPTSSADDLEACLEIQPSNIGGGIAGVEAARRIWRSLLGHPALLSAVVTTDPPIEGSRIAAFGAALFVSTEFLDAEISHPRPGVNDRLMACVARGDRVILDVDAISEANSMAGLDVLSLYGSWRHAAANEKTLSMLPGAFVQLSAGYNIKRILWEPVGEIERAFARESGVHRFLAEFPDQGRDLVVIDAESAARVPASLAPLIFASRKPALGLRKADRELLSAAVRGLTDAELAVALGVRLPAVKARWRSILLRISDVMPELIADLLGETTRGGQKRHRILDYMRTHPEELRPFRVREPEGTAEAPAKVRGHNRVSFR